MNLKGRLTASSNTSAHIKLKCTVLRRESKSTIVASSNLYGTELLKLCRVYNQPFHCNLCKFDVRDNYYRSFKHLKFRLCECCVKQALGEEPCQN